MRTWAHKVTKESEILKLKKKDLHLVPSSFSYINQRKSKNVCKKCICCYASFLLFIPFCRSYGSIFFLSRSLSFSLSYTPISSAPLWPCTLTYVWKHKINYKLIWRKKKSVWIQIFFLLPLASRYVSVENCLAEIFQNMFEAAKYVRRDLFCHFHIFIYLHVNLIRELWKCGISEWAYELVKAFKPQDHWIEALYW